jgi:ribonuclease P protein component
MLAKKYRLPIQSVLPPHLKVRCGGLNKSGHSFKSRYFLFKIFPGVEKFNRFGAIISKKVNKSAVKRNRLKRIILDSAGKFVLTNHINKYDILIIVSPAVTKLAKTDIIKEIDESLSKCLKI